MVDALYTRAASTALRLLTKYGQAVTLRAYTAGAYDPNTSQGTPTPSDTTRMGAVFDYPNGAYLDTGSLIQAGDKQLYLDANGAAPKLQDHIITADGVEWVIQNIKTLSPAGLAVVHEVQLRT